MALENYPDPEYGNRAVVSVVDDIAMRRPSQPFLYVSNSDDPRDGFKSITFGQLGNAVNNVAHKIATIVKTHSKEFNLVIIAYIGPSDVRYTAIALGCIKAGHQALFISPRNPPETQASLFENTNCKIILYAKNFGSEICSWLQKRPMYAEAVPDAEVWLKEPALPFPYTRSAKEARNDPFAILHTSGSTGIPKPIVVRQASLTIADGFRTLPPLDGSHFLFEAWAQRSRRFFLPFPMFHAAGILILTTFAIYYELPVVLPPPNRPLESSLALSCLTYAEVDSAFLPPVILEELALTDEGIRALANLNCVMYGGGALAQAAGDKLVENGTHLASIIGSTEHLPYPWYFHSHRTRLWNYFLLDSEKMGAEWRRVSEAEDVFELVVRKKNPQDAGDQAVFYTFPELNEWSTRDLFKPHPTLPNYWAHYGRIDNIIVFSNAEKLNPTSLEDAVIGHPAVKGALVVGQNRLQAALIVEPHIPPTNTSEAEALISSIWQIVEQINKLTVAHGRITRRLLAISDPAKPFPRAAKGTILRELAVKEYHSFIEHLYQRHPDYENNYFTAMDITGEESLTCSIVELVNNATNTKGLGPDTDFFSVGVDSLQVLMICDSLQLSLRDSDCSIDQRIINSALIYKNPTARNLARELLSASRGNKNNFIKEPAREEIAKNLLSKYSSHLPSPRLGKLDPFDKDQTVLLTGTTGSLGAYIMDRLCALQNVQKIIAVNRDADGGRSRQLTINTSRGLRTDFSKVEFLQANLSLLCLGIERSKYMELLDTTDRIIHNAWPVNFNLSISSFEPQICGVRRLVDFSSAARKNVPIVFISTIGTVAEWQSTEAVPERRLDDLSLSKTGYGLSKLLSSIILDSAAEYSKVPTASIRVGQIAGSVQHPGIWNRQEFIPSLIASSVYMGILPDHLSIHQIVDWMVIEDVACLILDIAGIIRPVRIAEISGYFNAVNPSTTQWTDISPCIQEFYGEKIQRLVSLEEWTVRLEESAQETTDINKNPAVKLVDTYRSLVKARSERQHQPLYSMERTKSYSPVSRNLTPITPALIRNWCNQWEF